MRKMWFALLAAGLMLGLGCQPAEEETEQAAEEPFFEPSTGEQAVKEALDVYITAIEREDMETYSGIMAQDENLVYIGAAADQWIVGWEELEAVIQIQNETFSETDITQSDLQVHMLPDGKHAWATSRWDLQTTINENPKQLPIRCTWILENREDHWVIIHFHKSVGMEQ